MYRTYRLYYWFKGVLPDRPGGPWWSRDFLTWDQRRKYLNDLLPFLHKWAYAESTGDGSLPVNHPPPHAQVHDGRPMTVIRVTDGYGGEAP